MSLQLEGHKLQYHPDRIADFLANRPVWPIYAEISPVSTCNHRCRFCNFNYLGHAAKRFPEGRMISLMDEFAQAGVKAVVFAGSGEPSLHPDTFSAMRRAKELGIDAAMSTNGAILRTGQIEAMADLLTWVRFSINGGDPGSYALAQGAPPGDLDKALKALSDLVVRKRRVGSSITIGGQCVLIPENRDSIIDLARQLKQRGADYFSLKHYYPHECNSYQPDMSFRTPEYLSALRHAADELSDDNFRFFVRNEECLEQKRPYTICLGLPFIIYVREDGRLYTCFSHQDDGETSCGSLLDTDFSTLWGSVHKEIALAKLNQYDKNKCQANCRHHQINLWLQQLANLPAHMNFI